MWHARLEQLHSFQEPQVERGKHQNDADVHHEPLPEVVPEKREIDADDHGYHGHDANGEQYRSCH